MNYAKHYGLLIERARKRDKPDTYLEKHHVTPKCMGGNDEPGNLVFLTAEEHFVAHQLLARIHPSFAALARAAFSMGNASGKRYAWLRERWAAFAAEKARAQWSNPAHRARVSAANTGKRATQTTKAKLSAALKRHFSDAAHRNVVSERTRSQFSDPERRKELSVAIAQLWGDEAYRAKLVGRKRSDEARQRMSAAALARPQLICPHCGKEGKGGNMKRYHFEKCFSAQQHLLKGAVTT